MNIEEIMQVLPHRYPFLMVDKILDICPGKSALGLKNLSINEPFFQGHFPGKPVMPGVLMIEAMAQVGACALLCQEEFKNKIALLAGVDHIRFKQQAVPGDTLNISTELISIRGPIGKAKGKITINNKTICTGEFLFAIVEKG